MNANVSRNSITIYIEANLSVPSSTDHSSVIPSDYTCGYAVMRWYGQVEDNLVQTVHMFDFIQRDQHECFVVHHNVMNHMKMVVQEAHACVDMH